MTRVLAARFCRGVASPVLYAISPHSRFSVQQAHTNDGIEGRNELVEAVYTVILATAHVSRDSVNSVSHGTPPRIKAARKQGIGCPAGYAALIAQYP